MTDTTQRDLQRDEAAVDEMSAAFASHIDERAMDTHTCLPGHIVSFDAATQTAKAQPGIQRIFAQQGAVNLPELVDVPVCFPGGGDFVLTFPVRANDECILMFSERAIDFWWQNGGVQLPAEYRTHDLSDAFAIVGVNSKPRALTGVSTTDVQLRARDGSAFVSIDPGGTIKLKASPATGNVEGTSGAAGSVQLNAPPGATPMLNGVLIGGDPCPLIGLTHGFMGGGCARVLGGKT
jgi:hypothetical protein